MSLAEAIATKRHIPTASATFAPNTQEVYYKSCKDDVFAYRSGEFEIFYAGAMLEPYSW